MSTKMTRSEQEWREQLSPYALPDSRRAAVCLTTSVVPYLGLSAAIYLLLGKSLLALLLCIPAAAFLVRSFIVFHDCTHGSFFGSRRANAWLGRSIGLLLYAPFHRWRHDHAVHHATAGNLDRRGTGDLHTLTVAGRDEQFPVNRVFCVGRNYAAHAREMGKDPDREPPFFFMKPANAVIDATRSQTVPYPPKTANYHHEIELVVAIGQGGRDIAVADALEHVYGYAVGIGWGEVKEAVFQTLDAFLSGPRKRYRELLTNRGEIDTLLAEGSAKARALAAPTIERVRRAVGVRGV